MDSVRFPANFSSTEGLGMRNNHLHNPTATTATTVVGAAAASTRMPDSSHNLNLLNQHVNHGNPVAAAGSMGIGGSKLFFTTQIESRDDLDDKHERCYNLAMSCISGKSEKEAIDALTVTVGKDPRAHEDACHGLLILILTGSSSSEGEFSGSRCFRDLTLINRDGLTSVLSHLTHLILEKYLKLLPHVKNQLIWLIRELVRNNVSGMDSVVWNLMRQIAGGDVTRGNLWLADSLLDLFNDFRSWLSKFPFLVASVAYTYLRLLEDHASPSFEKLREKEVRFVVSIVRDQFNEVMTIGRDFVRILQHVARLPEISDLWKDLLYHPRTLSPSFNGLSQLMETRTSRRFLQCRITPEMEKKLVFLTSQVKFGSHKRYQDWFQRQYLSTPESQSLRCDLIRFIVGVIHPTNELLCSDIIPRWAVIGWLLTTCTSQVAASNAKLALFYDWLFFQPEKDNIMNIEPAILVMHHSIKPHPAITATLLDFLCRIITNFFPKEQEKVRNGIYSSLKQILEKRVLPSLSPLFDNPKMDQELKFLLRERFSPFVNDTGSSISILDDNPIDVNTFNEPLLEDLSGVGPEFSDDEAEEVLVKVEQQAVSNATESKQKVNKKKTSSLSNTNNNSSQIAARKESSKPVSSPVKVRKRPVKTQSSSLKDNGNSANAGSIGDVDLGDTVKQLLSDLKSSTRRSSPVMGLEEDNIGLRGGGGGGGGGGGMVSSEDEVKCEVMDELIRVIVSEEFSYEQCNSLAQRLSEILSSSFEGKIYPDQIQGSSDLQEAFQDSVGKPIFVAFRALCDMVEVNLEGSGILLQVLADLYACQPRVGYYLLYFLSVDKQAKQRESKTKAAIYKDLCETIDANYCLDICLVNDMRQCQEDDVDLFLHLIPDVYNNFSKAALGNVNMLYLLVSCVDAKQIQTLLCHLLTKDLLLFKKDSFASIVTASLAWETFEQCALWQLIGAHDVPIDCIYTILPKLSFQKHAEALTATTLRLRGEKPNSDLIRHMLSREPVSGDKFVSTCLSHWIFQHEDKMADLISSYLSKYSSSNSSSSAAGGGSSSNLKRKRGSGAGSSSSSSHSSSSVISVSRKAEMALTHLDELRKLQNSRQYEFFNHPHLQKAVKHVRQSCSDEQKKKFMDLFAIAETESDNNAGEEQENNENDNSRTSQSSKTTLNRSSKNSSKSRKTTVVQDANDLGQESSAASDDNSDDEDNRPLLSGHRNKHHNNSNSRGSSRGNNKSRKRPSSKSSSYGAVIIDSSENTSDEETNAKKKKRRKKASAAHSDSD